jgi:hypothetical protein
MDAAESSTYQPSFHEKARVRLVKSAHSQNGQMAVILRALPNPSKSAEHQWYDVRFDSGVFGRFLESYLQPVSEHGENENPAGGQSRTA